MDDTKKKNYVFPHVASKDPEKFKFILSYLSILLSLIPGWRDLVIKFLCKYGAFRCIWTNNYFTK